MPTMYEQVIEFNEKILKIEPTDLGPMSENMAKHLKKSLDEESMEFQSGHIHGDFIKQIDSIIDGLYFGFGGLYKMGLTPNQVERIFAAVHNCNMTKKIGQVTRRATEGVPDAIKPIGWIPPEEEIARILDETADVK
jgi:predicted HAD superfamily Cof-like phosphohydrolase